MNIELLRENIIGNGATFETPYGIKQLIYADYTASGRNLSSLETEMIQIEALYANTHTEDNTTGALTTKRYHDAQASIRECLGATDDYALITTGSGATGAIHKLTEILGVYEAPSTKAYYLELINAFISHDPSQSDLISKLQSLNHQSRPVVFITPYEHHSNVLPWREGNVDVVEIGLTEKGLLDLEDLRLKVSSPTYAHRLKIGAFSAASNVTGLISPVWELAKIMHEHQGLAFFDYAASAPYVPIEIYKDVHNFMDGIYFSPHKFLGGPGTSGLLLIHKRIYNTQLPPTCAGGGTVSYVNQQSHDFKADIEAREDAGTPDILQTIRISKVLELKKAIGYEWIEQIEKSYRQQALSRLWNHANIEVIGPVQVLKADFLSIFSFNIRYEDGYLHPRFVTTLLNDLFGIQARAGCSCAGPYGHQLLGIDEAKSKQYREVILEGFEVMKPGWVRVNFHYILEQATVDFILGAICFIAENGYTFLKAYTVNPETGLWQHNGNKCQALQNQEHSVGHEGHSASTPTSLSLFGNTHWPELAWFYSNNPII